MPHTPVEINLDARIFSRVSDPGSNRLQLTPTETSHLVLGKIEASLFEPQGGSAGVGGLSGVRPLVFHSLPQASQAPRSVIIPLTLTG